MIAAVTRVSVPIGRWRRCIPDQAETFAYLERLTGRAPIVTQISAVFVGVDTVYKLKRAVTLSFLDFSSIALRRHFLERELSINAAAAPGLYGDVVPITRGDDGLMLAGQGEAVDWVLRMARVPEGDFLNADPGRFGPALLDALGDMVVDSHARLMPAILPDTLSVMRGNIEGNSRAALASGLPQADVAAWRSAALKSLEQIGGVLLRRAAAGMVRRVHGDLHLGNICLWQGRPVPFDAIEFDEAMATVDLGYDLAFLLMDLDHHVGRPAANRVMNRYVARTGDAEMVQLLPAFMSRRAMVRAHVLGGTKGLRYLASALAYTRVSPGGVVAIGGLPGTGKSTLARALAPGFGAAPGALMLRSDEIRKRLAGVLPEVRLGRDGYTPAMTARVHAELLAGVGAAATHGVVADATFISPALRRAVAGYGPPFVGIWLEAPVATLAARIAARTGDASDATTATLERMAATDLGAIDWEHVPADEQALARCERLLNVLASPSRARVDII